MKLQEHTRGLEDRTCIYDLRKCFCSRAGASPHLGGTFSGVHMTYAKRQVAKSFARLPINKSRHFQCLLFLAMTFCSRKYMKRWVASVNPCVRTCLGDSSNFSNFSSVSLGSLAVCFGVQQVQGATSTAGMGIHRRVVWMVDGWVLFHEVWRGNVIRDISARLAEEVAERVWSTSWDMSFLVFSYFGVLGSWIHRFWGLSVGDASAGKDCMLLTKKKCLKLLGLEPFLRGSCVKRLKRGSTESQLGPKCNKFSDCLMQFR